MSGRGPYGSNINLPSLDSLFSTEAQRQEAKLEKVQQLSIDQLFLSLTTHSRCGTMRKCRRWWKASRSTAC